MNSVKCKLTQAEGSDNEVKQSWDTVSLKQEPWGFIVL